MNKLEGQHKRYKEALEKIAASSEDDVIVAIASAALFPAVYKEEKNSTHYEGLNPKGPTWL